MQATVAAFSLNPSTQDLSLRSSQAGFILLGSFLLSFMLIRISVRLMRSPKVPWWPGSIKTEGGLHVHHLVFGIVLMLLCGFLAIAVYLPNPWYDLIAAGFGVGAGLTLDEYALWLHLDDVYWAEEGRRSVDAVIIAAVLGGLILLGARPLTSSDTELDDRDRGGGGRGAGVVRRGAAQGPDDARDLRSVFPPLAFWGLVAPGATGLAVGAMALSARRQADAPRNRSLRRQERRYRRWQDLIAGAPNVPAVTERAVAATAADDMDRGSASADDLPRD